ncbi:hypothetical protein SCHPADRAFT_945165 [Schizopora paradoxa]|uniref:G-protein coupled receptors family 1 profile domain-containing protein n=1 Tax=Schizopora paradoxa TaxID=27342 RepID=A0A0H2RS01_9AGAM|nr:hypothetical protein SCHPADRAFT_945165 [Schizopora paradoxa]
MPALFFPRSETETEASGSDSFTFGVRVGIVLIVQAGCISLIAVLSLLLYIAYCAVQLRHDPMRRWDASTPLHLYFLSLLIAEVLQETGTLMDLKWVIEATVNNGRYCTAQGILKQIGDVAVALSTLSIAVHTFRAIVLKWVPDRPRLVAAVVLGTIWTLIALIIGFSALTHMHEDYWGDTTYWCWIRSAYPVQQIVLDYAFMWTAAFMNIILYIPLALVIKGKLSIEGRRIRFRLRDSDKAEIRNSIVQAGRGADAIAMQMLLWVLFLILCLYTRLLLTNSYPLIYTITVLPIAIVRFKAFRGGHIPFGATVLADAIFSFSGLFNVILFSLTRPSLLPRRDSQMRALTLSARSRHSQTDASRPTVTVRSVASISSSRGEVLPDDSELNLDGDWGLTSVRSSRVAEKEGRLTITFTNPPLLPPLSPIARPQSTA